LISSLVSLLFASDVVRRYQTVEGRGEDRGR
jgi:hypothetical protein